MKAIILYFFLLLYTSVASTGSTTSTPADMKTESLFLYHLVLSPEYNDIGKWNEETRQVIQTHAEFLRGLGEKGILAFAGHTDFNPGHKDLFGIAVIKAASLEEAQKIMAPDPAVVNGIQKASIYPFSMGIRYLENLKTQ